MYHFFEIVTRMSELHKWKFEKCKIAVCCFESSAECAGDPCVLLPLNNSRNTFRGLHYPSLPAHTPYIQEWTVIRGVSSKKSQNVYKISKFSIFQKKTKLSIFQKIKIFITFVLYEILLLVTHLEMVRNESWSRARKATRWGWLVCCFVS